MGNSLRSRILVFSYFTFFGGGVGESPMQRLTHSRSSINKYSIGIKIKSLRRGDISTGVWVEFREELSR